jgi:ankyrin repeat protein
MVVFLLKQGVNVNSEGKLIGETALHHAISNGYANLVSLLLNNGADPRIKHRHEGDQMSHAINKASDLTIVSELADSFIANHVSLDPYLRGAHNQNYNKLEVMEMLIEKRANPNTKLDNYRFEPNETVLVQELTHEYYDKGFILALIENGKVDLNTNSSKDSSPLKLALECNNYDVRRNEVNYDVVLAMVEKGAKYNETDPNDEMLIKVIEQHKESIIEAQKYLNQNQSQSPVYNVALERTNQSAEQLDLITKAIGKRQQPPLESLFPDRTPYKTPSKRSMNR